MRNDAEQRGGPIDMGDKVMGRATVLKGGIFFVYDALVDKLAPVKIIR